MEKYSLKWNDFQLNASRTFYNLRKDKDFLDVTLVSEEGEHISAHKVVLSTSSDFFKDVLKKANHKNPLIYLSGFDSKVLAAVLDYIYNGKVNIYQEEIDIFLESAQKLKIHGLTQKVQEENKVSQVVESEIKSSISGGSYLKQDEDNSNEPVLQEAIFQEETTVATIDSSIVKRAPSLNYDEYLSLIHI